MGGAQKHDRPMASIKHQGGQRHRGRVSALSEGAANMQGSRLSRYAGAETNGKARDVLIFVFFHLF